MGSTVKKTIAGIGILVGGYLLIMHATTSGKLISKSTGGSAKIIKTLQGRT